MTAAEEEPGGAAPETSAERISHSGVGHAVAAGISDERLTAAGILSTLGGWRGVVESLLPALLFALVFVWSRDARLAAVVALVPAVAALAVRLIQRDAWQGAASGLVGVVVCVAFALLSGRGEDYYLPGFVINSLWLAAHTVSLLIGWPLIGLLIGAFRGSIAGWKAQPELRRAAWLGTGVWIALFGARLIVQVPMYLAARAGSASAVDALGLARILMGIPLFALGLLATWWIVRRAFKRLEEVVFPSPTSDE